MFTVVRAAAAAASFIGALLIIRPGSDAFQPAAVIALGAALFTGFEATLVKRLSRGEPVIRILLMNNGFAAAISVTTAALLFWTDPTPTQWAMMAALGVCMATAASLFTVAFKLADASALMPITYAMLVFTLTYDILLFELVPPALTLIGALVIGAATALLGWREHRARRKLIAAQLGA